MTVRKRSEDTHLGDEKSHLGAASPRTILIDIIGWTDQRQEPRFPSACGFQKSGVSGLRLD